MVKISLRKDKKLLKTYLLQTETKIGVEINVLLLNPVNISLNYGCISYQYWIEYENSIL